ncbi:Uncharacterised protein [Streptococcus pneumoniae]|nr:Uncharacterised protein [Streptococcus pneumoniae]
MSTDSATPGTGLLSSPIAYNPSKTLRITFMDSPSVAFATSIVGISEANDKLIACLSGALSFAFAPLALSLFPPQAVSNRLAPKTDATTGITFFFIVRSSLNVLFVTS